MKTMLQNFGSFLSILFVIWQDFVMFGRIHRAQSVTLLWLAYRIGVVAVLPDGVIQHKFYKNGAILHACVHGRRKDFSKRFSRGAKSG